MIINEDIYIFIIISSFSMYLSIMSIYIVAKALTLNVEKGLSLFSILLAVVSLFTTQSLADFAGKSFRNWDFTMSIFVEKANVLSMAVLFCLIWVCQILLRKNLDEKKLRMITGDSIKESLDLLPEGISFSQKDGTPLLVNTKMHDISFELFGKMVLNTNVFDTMLKEGQVKEGIKILSKDPSYIVKTPNNIWNIKYFDHGDLQETVALDITEEYQLIEEIEDRNNRLTKVNERLKDYSKKVDAYTREKEILAAKIKVHDDIGKNLVAFRAYLKNDFKDRDEIVSLWQESIAIIRGEAEYENELDSWDNLILAANRVKVDIKIYGELPDNNNTKDTIVGIILECLNNTVRHAHGDKLYVMLKDDEEFIQIKIMNNGIQPEEEILEKGGLLNIRKRVEFLGGEMNITSIPRFKLFVSIPKEF